VLDLLRQGLTNEQIAQSLGITRDTAKFHVSEILTKLGLESRREAAAWQGRPRVHPGWLPSFGLVRKLGAAGIVATAVLGALIIFAKEPSKPAKTLPPGIYVVDLATEHVASKLDLASELVESFDWAADESAFEVTSRIGGNQVRTSTFDAATGALVSMTESDETPFEFEDRWMSPDGKTVAKVDPNGVGRIEVRDVQSSALLETIDGLAGAGPFEVAWSPDSNWFALMEGPYDPNQPAELKVVSRQQGIATRTITPTTSPVDFDNGLNWLDWAPDSRSLAFVRNGQIWVLDVTSGNTRLRAAGSFPVLTEPRWSPDGRSIAFRSASVSSLYVATAAGDAIRYFAPGSSASISPDGRRIASLFGGQVAVSNEDGTETRFLGSTSQSYVSIMTDFYPSHFCRIQFPGPSTPAWSPDGKFLVLSGSGDPPKAYLMSSDGKQTPVMLDDGYGARWSPDGKHISFVRDCQVHVVPFNGSDAIDGGIAIDGYVYEWRGDGNLLVRTSSSGPGTTPDGIAIYSPDGTLLSASAGDSTISANGTLKAIQSSTLQDDGRRFFRTQIAETSSGRTIATLDNVSSVIFSPDSKWAAYTEGPCCESNLKVLDVSAPGSLPKLIGTARGILEIAWSPDSFKLAYTFRQTDQTGNDILAVFDNRAGSRTVITPNARDVQWFPDSETILFESGH
jgi:Tol biopolymer transport system component